jgi:hypothetical protein
MATHKGRAEWQRWSGTPSTVADIARCAHRLASNGGRDAELRIGINAAAWESEFITAEYFLDGLERDDVGDVEAINIDTYISDRRIAVTIERPNWRKRNRSGRSGITIGSDDSDPVVQLHVAGRDRGWVLKAVEEMSAVIAEGSVSMLLPRLLLLGSLPVVIGTAIGVAKTQGSPWHSVLIIALVASGTLLLATFLVAASNPLYELGPDGEEPRR